MKSNSKIKVPCDTHKQTFYVQIYIYIYIYIIYTYIYIINIVHLYNYNYCYYTQCMICSSMAHLSSMVFTTPYSLPPTANQIRGKVYQRVHKLLETSS